MKVFVLLWAFYFLIFNIGCGIERVQIGEPYWAGYFFAFALLQGYYFVKTLDLIMEGRWVSK